MNILYGVQATGNGHINRSREVIKELKSRGHNVLTIFSGRDSDKFWDIEEFSPYLIFRGITFKTKNGKINYLQTILNINITQFFKDVNELATLLKDYDLIISDFEPISLRAASIKKCFSINFSHQACFHYNDIPTKKQDSIGIWIAKNFAKGDLNIGIHWNRFNKKNIIVPPIVPPCLKDRSIPNKYLVYLPFENTPHVVSILSKLSSYCFYVYTPNRFDDYSNVFYRPFSRKGFLNDLQESEGIISNAGFEAISESLYLGRKILVKPVINQMEQESNAKCIEMLGFGKMINLITKEKIETFLQNAKSVKIKYPPTQKIFVDWIEEQKFDTKKLIQMSWE